LDYKPLKIAKNPKGRRIAIGDVHGCYWTLKALLEKEIKITKDDQVFLLGDLIDKGENSKLVLDYLMDFKTLNYEIYPIKGNHEAMLLAAYNCGLDFFEVYMDTYNSADLLDGDISTYLEFIDGFAYCIELDAFILSHSGLNKDGITPFTDMRGMFPNVNFIFDEAVYLAKIQITGHLVRTTSDVEARVKNKEKRISIDTGCYLKNTEFGILTGLDLDSRQLYHQKNIEP
jgi:serine/threonine protein phosphatase 1